MVDLLPSSPGSVLAKLLLGFAAFQIAKYIYRLTFHPLVHFPGPRLAAITNLYGASYDLSETRSYIKEMPALHEKYGKDPCTSDFLLSLAKPFQDQSYEHGLMNSTSPTWTRTISTTFPISRDPQAK